MLYMRFPRSFRNVEDPLHERGIDVSHETVRYWWQRFGPDCAGGIRNKRVAGGRSRTWRWRLDVIFVKIDGKTHDLWSDGDNEGEALKSYVTKRRDEKAAFKFIKKSMRKHGRQEFLTTERLRSYRGALREINAGVSKSAHAI